MNFSVSADPKKRVFHIVVRSPSDLKVVTSHSPSKSPKVLALQGLFETIRRTNVFEK